MLFDPEHQPSGDATPLPTTTPSNVVPLHMQPAPATKARKKAGKPKAHPPAVYRPPYTGKRVQDSPYYIDPTDRLDLLLAVTLDRELTPSARHVFMLIVAHYADSDEAGRVFRFQAGQHSNMEPATVPI